MIPSTPRLAVLFLALGGPAAAATAGDPLFLDDGVLEVRIAAPFTMLMDDRPTDKDVPGTFTFSDAGQGEITFDVGIRTRGRFRRDEDVCPFAPLRLNFKKSQTRNTLFDKQDKLKLVTHCRNRSTEYEQAVISEYLAYRIFNLVTDISFRARLLRVTYIDTGGKGREMTTHALLVESDRRLAKRIDAPRASVRSISVEDLQPEHGALTGVFQYLLSNTDHSSIAGAPGRNCCHNHELFGGRGKKFYSVPYDFDMTGFVDAPHAQPNPRFRLQNVRDRLYRGRCLHNEYVPAAVARFEAEREAIVALIENQPFLRQKTRNGRLRFLASFYRAVETPDRLRKNLLEDCI